MVAQGVVQMTVVFVCSPFRGDVEQNTAYARRAMRDCLNRGEAPFAPHLLYTQPGVLRDEVESERNAGIDAGERVLLKCDRLVVYTDNGVSQGMQYELAVARAYDIPIEFRTLDRSDVLPACTFGDGL